MPLPIKCQSYITSTLTLDFYPNGVMIAHVLLCQILVMLLHVLLILLQFYHYFIVTLDPEVGRHVFATARCRHTLNYQFMPSILFIQFLLGYDRRCLDNSLPQVVVIPQDLLIPYGHALLRPLEGILNWLLLPLFLALIGAIVMWPNGTSFIEIAMSFSSADLAQGLKMTHVAFIAQPVVVLLHLEIKYSTHVEEYRTREGTNNDVAERAGDKQIIMMRRYLTHCPQRLYDHLQRVCKQDHQFLSNRIMISVYCLLSINTSQFNSFKNQRSNSATSYLFNPNTSEKVQSKQILQLIKDAIPRIQPMLFRVSWNLLLRMNLKSRERVKFIRNGDAWLKKEVIRSRSRVRRGRSI